MTVSSAVTAVQALRCAGIANNRHYGVSAFVPNVVQTPALVWQYSFLEDGVFRPEIYDLQAGSVYIGMVLRLFSNVYSGVGEADEIAGLPLWLDRITDMLSADMLLNDSLVVPLSGDVRVVGIVEWRRRRYVGITMGLNLIVRFEAP